MAFARLDAAFLGDVLRPNSAMTALMIRLSILPLALFYPLE